MPKTNTHQHCRIMIGCMIAHKKGKTLERGHTLSAKLRVVEKSKKGSESSCPGMPPIVASTVSCVPSVDPVSTMVQ